MDKLRGGFVLINIRFLQFRMHCVWLRYNIYLCFLYSICLLLGRNIVIIRGSDFEVIHISKFGSRLAVAHPRAAICFSDLQTRNAICDVDSSCVWVLVISFG